MVICLVIFYETHTPIADNDIPVINEIVEIAAIQELQYYGPPTLEETHREMQAHVYELSSK